jgi:hypothetical protein
MVETTVFVETDEAEKDMKQMKQSKRASESWYVVYFSLQSVNLRLWTSKRVDTDIYKNDKGQLLPSLVKGETPCSY